MCSLEHTPIGAVKTDEEVNLREIKNPDETLHKCLFCKFLTYTFKACTNNHNVTNARRQVCDEWRYIV